MFVIHFKTLRSFRMEIQIGPQKVLACNILTTSKQFFPHNPISPSIKPL